MKKPISHQEATLGPLLRKTFRGALTRELKKQIPSLGALTANALATHIEKMVDEYFPPIERLRMGQVLWPAVDEHETAGYGKRIEDTRIKPVLLEARTLEDITDMLEKVPAKHIRKKVAVRLFSQAKQQGGVLTGVDVGVIMGLTAGTISRYVREHEKETGDLVPRRGTVHDMGPSLTHKREICRRVILQGHSIGDTARSTNHSPEAVTRYVFDYRRVFTCIKHGLSISQTAYATHMSKNLVQQYVDLIPQKKPLPAKKEEC